MTHTSRNAQIRPWSEPHLALALTGASAVALAQDTGLEQRILQSLTPVAKPAPSHDPRAA